jgi:hypothetical protein
MITTNTVNTGAALLWRYWANTESTIDKRHQGMHQNATYDKYAGSYRYIDNIIF